VARTHTSEPPAILQNYELITHPSRSLVTWYSFSVGAIEIPLPDCTEGGLITRLQAACDLFPKLASFALLFWLPDCTGATTLMMAAFFSVDNRSFTIILLGTYLLHSCTHCDLDHSHSLLHMPRNTVTWSSFSVGRAMVVPLPNCTGALYQSPRWQLPGRWQQNI